MKRLRAALLILSLVASGDSLVAAAPPNDANKTAAKARTTSARGTGYTQTIVPLLGQYCFDCHGKGKHKGDVALDRWPGEAEALADHKTWVRVLQMVQTHEMPPSKKPQPTPKERETLTKWIESDVLRCDCEHPDPGRVTIRRLNRAEYNNTIRDLLGVDFKPADDFPVDGSGYGFDNIGDALSMPPVLIEKYLAAAQRIIETARMLHTSPKPVLKRFPVDALEVGYNARQRGDGWVALNSIEEDDVAAVYEVPVAGEFAVRVHAYARPASTNAMKLTFMLDHLPVKVVEVETNQSAAKVYEATVSTPPGRHRFRAVVRRVKDGLSESAAQKWKSGPQQKGDVLVEWLELEGPFNVRPPETAEAIRRSFTRQPSPGRETDVAREILAGFARRAYRRPVTRQEVDGLVELAEGAWQRGGSYDNGISVALSAVLVSPHFLFRGEWQPEPDNPKSVHPINEHALASRLSYFLWSSLPDEELLAQAGRGTLRRNLAKQVRRMLLDAKSRALVDNFAGQWLQLRNLVLMTPDPDTFPKFDEPLRDAMRRETELLFATIMREDRSVFEFLNADYTFVNERLAKHYGMPEIEGDDFRRVSLAATPRRGVLTHASILTLTSNPTRTSPVKRGKWILDNLLNTPPPPPLPDVPELKEERVLTGTLRQRMEQHRADPLCSSCHERMDPLGFGLENLDGIGAWRDQEGKFPIDATGVLVTGEQFKGPTELLNILANDKKNQFLRCLAEKMLTYALGRGLEYYDKCAIDEITANLAKSGHGFSGLILEVVKSTPFQKRRGENPPTL